MGKSLGIIPMGWMAGDLHSRRKAHGIWQHILLLASQMDVDHRIVAERQSERNDYN